MLQEKILKPAQLSSAIAHSSVSIRPFVNGKRNMGLEAYDLVVADGVYHKDGVIALGEHSVKTYVTGLNEASSDMVLLRKEGETNPTKMEEYNAKVLDIRRTIARAERELGGNAELDPNDPDILKDKDFWKRVKTFQSVIPDTFDSKGDRIPTYWDSITLKLDNHGQALNPERLVLDLLIMKIAEAGGFAIVAPSLTVAAETNKYKFYLDKREAAAEIQISPKIMRDKAGKELLKMYEGDANKLFYVTKLVSLDSLFYRKGSNSTPLAVLYNDSSRYLDGEGMEKSKTTAATKFLEYCKMDLEELRLRCMIKDATTRQYLSFKADGTIYHNRTSTPIGKNVADCIVYLKDPLNQSVYEMLKEDVEKEWNA